MLDNDPTLVPPLIAYLNRCLQSARVCDEPDGIRVCVALEEAMNNAMFHGNLELGSEVRNEDLTKYRSMIEERRTSPPFDSRKVYVQVKLNDQMARFTIRDEGPGFDPNSLPDPTDPDNLEKAGGRGLLLMKTFMDEVHYNEVGNEVVLVKYHCAADVANS